MFRATDHRGSINSFLTRLCRCSLSVLSTNKLKDQKCPISNPVSFPRVINGRLLFNNRFSGRFTLSVQFPKPTKSRARFSAEDSLCQINPPNILIFFFVWNVNVFFLVKSFQARSKVKMKIIKSVALISDFNFNVFAPQTINNRLENFLYFWFVFWLNDFIPKY